MNGKRKQIGDRHERLEIVQFIDKKKMIVQCDCGTKKEIYRGNFTKQVSCGCWKSERSKTHGHSQYDGGAEARNYKRWNAMRMRCINPNDHAYKYYGGRGISVCDRWNDYDNFLSDMGIPDSGMTLDRIDGNRDYTPDNCRWISQTEQMQNLRCTNRYTVNGKTLSLAEWATELGTTKDCLRSRLRRGWSEQRAFA